VILLLPLLLASAGFAKVRGDPSLVKQDRSVTAFNGINIRSGIDLSGGGDARIHVEKELTVNASGGSQIYLSGDPHVDANLSGNIGVIKYRE
jgi:hypothetical protein